MNVFYQLYNLNYMLNLFSSSILKRSWQSSRSIYFIYRLKFGTDPFKDRPKYNHPFDMSKRNISQTNRKTTEQPFKSNLEQPPKINIQQIKAQKIEPQEIRADQIISKNEGLNKFLSKVYNTTGICMMGSIGAGYAATYIPFLMANAQTTVILGAIFSAAAFMGVSLIKPEVIKQIDSITPKYRVVNPISRLLLFSLGIIGLGVSASPVFLAVNMVSPNIIPAALGITAGIFGGASLMSYSMPKDKMIGYGRILSGSLLGLISMQLVGLASSLFFGPNFLSQMIFTIDNYAGIILMFGLIGYDTHIAIKQFESGNADYLEVSIRFLLDIWNIFIRVVTILANSKKNK